VITQAVPTKTLKITVTDEQGVVLDHATVQVPAHVSELDVTYGGPDTGTRQEVAGTLTIGK
jgi:GH35 family endo-1,4-beta-xylanase